jgi:hypothetical protein
MSGESSGDCVGTLSTPSPHPLGQGVAGVTLAIDLHGRERRSPRLRRGWRGADGLPRPRPTGGAGRPPVCRVKGSTPPDVRQGAADVEQQHSSRDAVRADSGIPASRQRERGPHTPLQARDPGSRLKGSIRPPVPDGSPSGVASEAVSTLQLLPTRGLRPARSGRVGPSGRYRPYGTSFCGPSNPQVVGSNPTVGAESPANHSLCAGDTLRHWADLYSPAGESRSRPPPTGSGVGAV